MKSLTIKEVGQIARHVNDIEASSHWFEHVLGLTHLYSFGQLAFFDCGGLRLFLSAQPGQVAPNPVIYFRVDDIQAGYDELRLREVQFTSAPHLIHRHENGIEEWMAFFVDNDNQPLALMSQRSSSPG